MCCFCLILPGCAPQVTIAWLINSFEDPWLEPSDGRPYEYRMVHSMTPRNTVPCQMHAQIRVTPQILAICWYAIEGVGPAPAPPALRIVRSLLHRNINVK